MVPLSESALWETGAPPPKSGRYIRCFFLVFQTGDEFTDRLGADNFAFYNSIGIPSELTYRASYAAVVRIRENNVVERLASVYNDNTYGPSVISGQLRTG